MCGIFGMIGKGDVNKLKMLAVLNESRGRDAWGFWNGSHYLKNVGLVRDAISNKFFMMDRPYVLGHTRSKTHGANTAENAHPFFEGNVVGAHNGVVRNFEEVKKAHDWKCEVDSQVIFKLLDKEGPRGLRELSAYWGLWWVDRAHEDEVNLMCHDHYLAVARDKDAVYFSSDEADLKRVGLKPWKLKEDMIYTVNVDTLKITKEKVSGLQKPKAITFSMDEWGRTGYGQHTRTYARVWCGMHREYDCSRCESIERTTKERKELASLTEKLAGEYTDQEAKRYMELAAKYEDQGLSLVG